ncbi:MAG: ribosomal-processing cysteine protease Prp [bacterium]|nr:ribosomal-processing cysteine protease Prp [bacterium]
MLRVLVKKKNNEFYKISLIGHTEYDDYGKDIVCSSASSIMITTVNALLEFDKSYITYEEKKNAFYIIINKNDDISNKLIQNMINMFSELSKKYSKNIKIEEE